MRSHAVPTRECGDDAPLGQLRPTGFHAAEQPIVVWTGNGAVATSPTIAAATRSL